MVHDAQNHIIERDIYRQPVERPHGLDSRYRHDIDIVGIVILTNTLDIPLP